MANEQNLVSLATRSQRERTEIAKMGQSASVKARKENKLIKDRILERMGETDWDAMIDGLISRAIESDKAFEILRDTVGQKPTEKIEHAVNDEGVRLMDEFFSRSRTDKE